MDCTGGRDKLPPGGSGVLTIGGVGFVYVVLQRRAVYYLEVAENRHAE